MDDKACRLEILRELKKLYDGNLLEGVKMGELISVLGMEKNALARNMSYLVQKGLARATWTLGGTFVNGHITAMGIDFLESGEPSGLATSNPLTVHQEFNAPVGAVAGRDINIQITFTEVLNKLADVVEADQKISLEEKRSLIDRLKSLGNNEWIRSIGTSVLSDLIKKSVGL